MPGPADPWPASDPSRPELGLILSLARRRPPAELAALIAGVDFGRLREQLLRQKLLGLLGSRLLDALGPADVPAQFAVAVDEIIAAGREDAFHMQLLTWRLLQSLSDAGVTAMALKGPQLAERLHGDAALRLSHDVDLLVAPAQIPAAVVALEALGWSRPRIDDALPRLHHIFESPDGPPIELHWRIHWYERRYATAMLARAQPLNGVLVPTPADELVSLLLFHARDGLAGLRTPLDVAAWFERHGAGVSPADVAAVLAGHPELLPAVRAAALSVQCVLELPVAALVAPPARGRRRIRAAVELTDWPLARPPAEADAATKLVDGLLTGTGDLPGFVVRAALPRLPGNALTRPFRQLLYALALVGHCGPLVADLLRTRNEASRVL